MKRLLPLLFLFFCVHVSYAQFEMGFHYRLSLPLSTLAQNIQPANSFAISGYGRLADCRNLYLGGEISFGQYAHKTQQETFISPHDGSLTTTNVDFNSNIFNYHVIVGYDFTRCTTVIPYVIARIGGTRFNSEIIIEDPDEHDSCHPLDKKTLIDDGAFSIGGGAGLKVDAVSVFKNWRKGICYFDFSANYLWGSSLDYVNVKYLNTDNTTIDPTAREVNVRFIDINTQEIHEHQVARINTSTINFLEFKIGIVKTFGGGCNQ